MQCVRCNETVYDGERFPALSHPFHRRCFRCTVCDHALTVSNHTVTKRGQPFCKKHAQGDGNSPPSPRVPAPLPRVPSRAPKEAEPEYVPRTTPVDDAEERLKLELEKARRRQLDPHDAERRARGMGFRFAKRPRYAHHPTPPQQMLYQVVKELQRSLGTKELPTTEVEMAEFDFTNVDEHGLKRLSGLFDKLSDSVAYIKAFMRAHEDAEKQINTLRSFINVTRTCCQKALMSDGDARIVGEHFQDLLQSQNSVSGYLDSLHLGTLPHERGFPMIIKELWMYVQLAGNYYAALSTIEHCFNQKPQLFAKFVDCQEMQSLLNTTLAYPQRWREFFSRLTPQSAAIKQALQGVEEIIAAIPRAKEDSRNRAEIAAIHRKHPRFSLAAKRSRRLLWSGQMGVIFSSNIVESKVIHLFDDSYVVADPVSPQADQYFLQRLQMSSWKGVITLRCPGSNLTPKLFTANNEFHELLRNAIDRANSHICFGVALEVVCKNEGSDIPLVVSMTVECLKERVETEGIFRLSGRKLEEDKLKEEFDSERKPTMDELKQLDPHLLATLLKRFFREIPNSLIPDNLLRAHQSGQMQDLEIARLILRSLPRCNHLVLKYWFSFLSHVASASHGNKMPIDNLVKMATPNLCPPEWPIESSFAFVRFLLEHEAELLTWYPVPWSARTHHQFPRKLRRQIKTVLMLRLWPREIAAEIIRQLTIVSALDLHW